LEEDEEANIKKESKTHGMIMPKGRADLDKIFKKRVDE